MARTWADRQRERGVRLELTPFTARNCWKKFRDGKVHYLHHPLTKAGYEAALLEWRSIVADLDQQRPNAEQFHHHRNLFQKVRDWFDQFGIPAEDKQLAAQVDEFLEWIEGELQQPTLPNHSAHFFIFSAQRKPFWHEFVERLGGDVFGTPAYELPGHWQERLRQLGERNRVFVKEPQTIGHWLNRYLQRVDERTHHAIKIRTGTDRQYKLADLRCWADQSAHVTTIDDEMVRQYHSHLAQSERSRTTKIEYFKAFRMFVRWASKQSGCELTEPPNLDDREFVFREINGIGRKREEKKKQLWTPEEFKMVLEQVPQPYRCYLLLMLNCGFRNSDLSQLRKSDLRLDDGRIVYQREKLNQNDTSPVVSYRLWPKTIELIKETMCDDEMYVFQTSTGGRLVVEKRDPASGEPVVYDTVSRYWRASRKRFGLVGKRLDFIRKTGSTIIEKFSRGTEVLYLADSLKSVPRIHYNFNDGEPWPEFDEAIQHLGEEFGLVQRSRTETLTLSGSFVELLTQRAVAQGVSVEELLAAMGAPPQS